MGKAVGPRDWMAHLNFLHVVADGDVAHLLERESTYQGSWKRSGGRSAWFMVKRKIDRILQFLKAPEPPADFDPKNVHEKVEKLGQTKFYVRPAIVAYLLASNRAEDIFALIEADPSGRDGTVLAEVRDLRQYLLLIESEMMSRGVVPAPARTFVGVDLASDPNHPSIAFVSSDGKITPVPLEDSNKHAARSVPRIDPWPYEILDSGTWDRFVQRNPNAGFYYSTVSKPGRTTHMEWRPKRLCILLADNTNVPADLDVWYGEAHSVVNGARLLKRERLGAAALAELERYPLEYKNGLEPELWLRGIYNEINDGHSIVWRMGANFVDLWGIADKRDPLGR